MKKIKKNKFRYKIEKNNEVRGEIQRVIERDCGGDKIGRVKNIGDYSDGRE